MTTIYSAPGHDDEHDEGSLVDMLTTLLEPARTHWKAVVAAALVCSAIAVGVSFALAPKFTAANVFLPPQQQQSSATSALAAMAPFAPFSTGGAGVKNPPDTYIGLMESATVSDRIIQRFKLMSVWDEHYHVKARALLAKAVSISAGKKDNLMRVEVTDTDPQRAAAMANQYVEELRALTTGLAVTEAQQRRMFFEQLLQKTRDSLAAAQTALEAGGYSAGALNVEPANAAEGYARLSAERTAAEVRLQVLRRSLADSAPEIQTQQEAVNALNSQLSKLETQDRSHTKSSDYINRYREFKYQETLFDLFARQYENARVDESREGSLIQVVDPATPPELKSSPSRSKFGAAGAALGALLAVLFFLFKSHRPEHPLSG